MKKEIKKALTVNGLILATLIMSAIFHNIISGILKAEEPLFFSLCLFLSILFPLTAIFYAMLIMVSCFNRRVIKRKHHKPKSKPKR